MSKVRVVAFHVQAGSRVGMGHLMRSEKLMLGLRAGGFEVFVTMAADSLGLKEAASRGIQVSQSYVIPPAALILDAVHVPEDLAACADSYYPRILLSPQCDRAAIATHVLVRDAPEALLESLTSDVRLSVNFDYAFHTASDLPSFALDYDVLKVGVCLSGGDDPINLDAVISAIADIDDVVEIRVIDRRRPASVVEKEVCLHHVPFCVEPWRFFDGINVFVGGDGIMLSEAIAQGIPSVSLTSNDRIAKNRSLIESGALRTLLRSPFNKESLTRLLRDRYAISGMHYAAKRLNGGQRSGELFQSILKILNHETAS